MSSCGVGSWNSSWNGPWGLEIGPSTPSSIKHGNSSKHWNIPGCRPLAVVVWTCHKKPGYVGGYGQIFPAPVKVRDVISKSGGITPRCYAWDAISLNSPVAAASATWWPLPCHNHPMQPQMVSNTQQPWMWPVSVLKQHHTIMNSNNVQLLWMEPFSLQQQQGQWHQHQWGGG